MGAPSVPPLLLDASEYAPQHAPQPLRAKTLGKPTVRVATQRRYPSLFEGDMLAGGLLDATFRRRGASLTEIAEDWNILPKLIGQWIRFERSTPLGAVLVLKNKRLADAILHGALDIVGERHAR